MIPQSLHLTDFLSYKRMEEPLDLRGLRLACLSGANGHGKSALLDAITWALWGKARGCEGGQEQDRLIRDGAEATSVELVFLFDDQLYRVRRSRWRNGRSELLVAVKAADGSWTDLAGEGINDTQRRLIALLRMDYETFVASAFVLQGRADTFTVLKPAERKEVLGRILGLEVYEHLAERARERKRDAQAEAAEIKAALSTLERDLAQAPDLEARLADAQRALEALAIERAKLDARREETEHRLAELRSRQAAAEQAARRASEAEDRVAGDVREVGSLEQREVALAKRASPPPGGAALAAELPSLEVRERGLESARSRHDELAAEVAALQARIDQEAARLDTEVAALDRRIAEAEATLATENAARELLARAEERLQELAEASAERERLLGEHTQASARMAAIDAEARDRERRRGEAREKLSLIEAEAAVCPLCGEALTAAHRKEIRASFRAELKELDAADRAAATERKDLDSRMKRIERAGRAAREALAERERIAEQAVATRTELEGFVVLRTETEARRVTRTDLAARVGTGAFATTEREKLASVRAELDEAAYKPSMLVAVKDRLAQARLAASSVQDANAAADELDHVRATLERARTRLAATRDEGTRAREETERLRVDPTELTQAESAARELATRCRSIEELVSERAGERRAAELGLEALEQKRIEAEELRARNRETTRRGGLYDKLAKVFGRDGIPARIIGNAIPELRSEANDLLRALTDGRLTISIDPVRETKAKTAKETLDVTVYDLHGGKRPYEMYSGGERLRIDFALRVALSRLLARRAGARLETLVIDEGFGSQDADGRARLVEAIVRIRSLFSLVLVVTHLDELKDQFPSRIEVHKDDVEGSTARVL
jgi:DNA repair protein SbcC/Rad50